MTLRRAALTSIAACVIAGLATQAAAQGGAPATAALDRPLRVFIDCRGPGCDQEFFRRELVWVDHVRDQKDSDVHILVVAQGTGGGGSAYTFRFLGHGQWEGETDSFIRAAEAGDTDDVRRRMLAAAFGLGLARFAAATPAGARLRVSAGPAQVSTQSAPADDPWNLWVFRLNGNLNLNGEATSRFANMNLSQSANRTTDAWKINVGASINYNESRYELGEDEGGTFVSTRRGWNINSLVVKSLTDRWSLAAKAGASRSTFLNQKSAVRAGPGVEYNFYPYAESSQRSLTVQWTAGINRFVYDEITIFDTTRETRWDQAVIAQLNLRQPFGSIGLTTEAAHYFEDLSAYRFAFNADTDIRLTRGLSLRLDGNYQLVHDQLYLRRGEATSEEIIARQQQLKTSFRYFVSIGVTYRFGSINNNVVNPRFGGGPGGFF